MTITLAAMQAELLAQRALYLPELHAIVCSDVHLGKTSTFRHHGLAVPDGPQTTDLQRLDALVRRPGSAGCAHLIVVGDLVHARHNHEWDRFAALRATWDNAVTLVSGNHDRHAMAFAQHADIAVTPRLEVGTMAFVHSPEDAIPGPEVTICGHLHPAVVLHGRARQNLRLPCFWHRGSIFILPAFGSFTGSMTITPQHGDRVWAIAADAVHAVHQT